MTNAPIGPSNAVPKTKFMPAHRGTKSASPSSPLSKGRSSARADSRRVFCDGGVHCTGLAHPRTHFSVKPFVEYLQGRRAAGLQRPEIPPDNRAGVAVAVGTPQLQRTQPP
jgi:hypothetical protein